MSKHTVKVSVFHNDIYGSMISGGKYGPDTLMETRDWIDGLLAKIPEEFRDSAIIEIESVGGYEGEHHAEVEVYYQRPETAEERAVRKANEQAHQAHSEQVERRTLAALKAKYEKS